MFHLINNSNTKNNILDTTIKLRKNMNYIKKFGLFPNIV